MRFRSFTERIEKYRFKMTLSSDSLPEDFQIVPCLLSTEGKPFRVLFLLITAIHPIVLPIR